MFNNSYGSDETLKKVIEIVHLIKSNWLYFKENSVDNMKITLKSNSPTPGIEPGSAGWEPAILTN